MKNCKHERTLILNSKASDMHFCEVPHLTIEKDGYAPNIPGLCNGDYVDLTVCLDCGTVIGFEPMSDEEVLIAFEIEAEDDGDGDEWN